jgi:hypothetical protein
MNLNLIVAIAAAVEDALPQLNGGGLNFSGKVRQVIDRILAHLNGWPKFVRANRKAFVCRVLGPQGCILGILPAKGLELEEGDVDPPQIISNALCGQRLKLRSANWRFGLEWLPTWRVGNYIIFVSPLPPSPRCVLEERRLKEAKAKARKLLAEAGIDLSC